MAVSWDDIRRYIDQKFDELKASRPPAEADKPMTREEVKTTVTETLRDLLAEGEKKKEGGGFLSFLR